MEPGVIDFDDCMTHWYVADLARTVGYFRETARGRMGPYETAFMGGYRDVRRIEPEWLELLPVFLRLALISEFAWMNYASQATARGVRFTAEDAANLREIIRGLGGTTSV
jgi:Ser/Thr protein kinase RdoA (MazF antagonist)